MKTAETPCMHRVKSMYVTSHKDNRFWMQLCSWVHMYLDRMLTNEYLNLKESLKGGSYGDTSFNFLLFKVASLPMESISLTLCVKDRYVFAYFFIRSKLRKYHEQNYSWLCTAL